MKNISHDDWIEAMMACHIAEAHFTQAMLSAERGREAVRMVRTRLSNLRHNAIRQEIADEEVRRAP